MSQFVLVSIVVYCLVAEIITTDDEIKPAIHTLTEKGYKLISAPDKSKLPSYFSKYGQYGKNFYLDENYKPYILCEKYNVNNCVPGKSVEECSSLVKCYPETRAHELRCMAVLLYNTSINQTNVQENFPNESPRIAPVNILNASSVLKGCWTQFESELSECNTEDMCIADTRHTGFKDRTAMFCCCKTHNCNRNLSYIVAVQSTTTNLPRKQFYNETWFEQAETVLSIALIIFLFICVCMACCFFFYALRSKLHKNKDYEIKQQVSYNGLESNSNESDECVTLIGGKKMNPLNITISEVVANGRFGQVYKAMSGEMCLAVKVFPSADVDSWICEQEIYSIELLRSHPNIATFVAAFPQEKFFWLLTMYCEKGSLHDYLKNNIISLHVLGKIAYSMLNGLAFLHEEVRGERFSKPVIVHRDFKSKNILLKDNMTACIADFGLALKCENRRVAPDGTHGQVGTRRYMSPELLEGAMEFSSFAFQQTDVYAASLVLWELLSRTRLPDFLNEQILNYKLPFELEIGHSPSLGEMRNLVIIQKYRPQVREVLYHNEFSNAIMKTMVEMWDKEPDARITSGCARDRMFRISEAIIRYHGIDDINGNASEPSLVDMPTNASSSSSDNSKLIVSQKKSIDSTK